MEAACYMVFDAVSGDPLTVKVEDIDDETGERQVLAENALIVCETEEGCRSALRKMFPLSPDWADSRFQIRRGLRDGCKDFQLIAVFGVSDTFDGETIRPLSYWNARAFRPREKS